MKVCLCSTRSTLSPVHCVHRDAVPRVLFFLRPTIGGAASCLRWGIGKGGSHSAPPSMMFSYCFAGSFSGSRGPKTDSRQSRARSAARLPFSLASSAASCAASLARVAAAPAASFVFSMARSVACLAASIFTLALSAIASFCDCQYHLAPYAPPTPNGWYCLYYGLINKICQIYELLS